MNIGAAAQRTKSWWFISQMSIETGHGDFKLATQLSWTVSDCCLQRVHRSLHFCSLGLWDNQCNVLNERFTACAPRDAPMSGLIYPAHAANDQKGPHHFVCCNTGKPLPEQWSFEGFKIHSPKLNLCSRQHNVSLPISGDRKFNISDFQRAVKW